VPFKQSVVSIFACSVLLFAGSAGATVTFVIDSEASSLGIVNAEFNKIPPTFQTTLEPVSGDDWIRSLSGTFMADGTTGALESANIQIDDTTPLAGDQYRLDSRGNPRDVGDIVLSALAFSVDIAGNATFTAGTIDFDLSLGDTRISSPMPFSLVGVTATTTNMGDTVFIGSHITIPIVLEFVDIQVFTNGAISFSLAGTIEGTVVPEPSTALTLTLGLAALATCRPRRS